MKTCVLKTLYGRLHCDLKVSRSQTKFDESFANYFLKTKANNKCFEVLKCTSKVLQKSLSELDRKNPSPRLYDTSKSTLS